MTDSQIVMVRRANRRLQIALVVLFLAFGAMAVFTLGGSRVHQRDALYLPAPHDGRLAAVERAPERGLDVNCVVVREPGDEQAAPARYCPDDVFELAGHVYRVEAPRGTLRIELVGVRLDAGVLGAARAAARQLRLPGVGAEHIEVLPAAECPDDRPCVRSLVAGDRTLLESAEGDMRRLPPGLLHPVSEGDVFWLGLSPLVASTAAGGISFTLPLDYEDYRGDRGWIFDPAPRWNLVGPGPWELRSERDLFTHGHLETRRIDRQLEEEIQRLVDQEVLCLVRGVPRTDRPPHVVWSDGQGCDPDFVQPVTSKVASLRTRYRHHPGLLAMIDKANRHLADGSYVARPEVLSFTFDWAYMVAPWAEGFEAIASSGDPEAEPLWTDVEETDLLVPVPTRLLGFWWGRTDHGVPAGEDGPSRKKPRASVEGGPAFDLRVRHGTTSAQLRVEAPDGPIGPLRHDDLLLLTGAAAPLEVEIEGEAAVLLGSVCVGAVGDSTEDSVWLRAPESGVFDHFGTAGRGVFGAVFPLGRLTFSPDRGDRMLLQPLRAPAADSCLHLARTSEGGYSWSAATAAPSAAPEGEAPAAPPARVWQAVQPGSSIPLDTGALVLRDNGDLAATSVYDGRARTWRRVYPFEEDAGQLIGRGRRHYSGVEASLTSEMKARVEDDLELTIHGDLQRVVSRALTTAMEVQLAQLKDSPRAVKNPGTRRGTAVLMDSDTGEVLAAATWPPFDPNLGAQEEHAWRAELRAQGVSFDPAENWAFVRNNAAGSTYKLATGIALAEAGLLEGADRPVQGHECSGGWRSRFGGTGGLRVYRWIGRPPTRVLPRKDPHRKVKEPGYSHHRCESNHHVIPPDGRAIGSTFVEAFAGSCNVWFSLAAYHLMDRVIPMGPPTRVTLDTTRDDLGLGDGPRLFSVDDRLGVLWPKDRPIAEVVAPEDEDDRPLNRYSATLLQLGHRFLYAVPGRTATQQLATEWAPDRAYPTSTPERAWMAGLRPGLGFRYPELPGPAAYGGGQAWPAGEAPPPDWEGGRLSSIRQDRSYRGAAVLGWGQEVSASALSLATMTTVSASGHGRAPVPRVILSPDPLLPTERAAALDQPSPVLLEDAEPVRAAMRRVPTLGTDAPPPESLSGGRPRTPARGTAWRIFRDVAGLENDGILEWVGGKTGTIQIQVPVDDNGLNLKDSLRRVRFYACGVLLPDELLGDSPEARHHEDRFKADWSWFEEEMETEPTFGFASSGSLCRSLVPGLPPVAGLAGSGSEDDDPVKRWERLYRERSRSRKLEKVSSSAFVAASFDGIVAGASAPEGVAPSLSNGRGLSLAVIADNHPLAAKEAAVAILSDLSLYYRTRGDALPRAR